MTTDGDTDRARQPEEHVRLRTPEQPSVLPDWMLDPPPPRRTLGVRLAEAVAALPGAGRIRRRWWIWQRRERLSQRYPNAVKIMAVLVSFAVILLLVLSVHALYGLA
ncbi:hypothetical protein SAMN05443287_101264 [Micromonospora phaseoli]|uniref:Uncharacterized protein n=1 Tax=Micromonospora phaseoli TaxID=1144548 RepID=A0A1H6RIH5_9ACTN|nr:hypothetical protein [Micromonospora phaseoli]PZW03520.1 hypothetical protein CLV64_101264 [Micromonospora phaseoli]GIJ77086.1 hypothetical protein Xph01_15180 [Micromonospora phaseoli]SEI55611.1 hypothetical protein SAMN05443287_101264 [Micromonospora phaseoli]